MSKQITTISKNRLTTRVKIGGFNDYVLTFVDAQTGSPLPAVTVSIMDQFGNVLSVEGGAGTGIDGVLTLTGIDDSINYTVTASKSGYKDLTLNTGDLSGQNNWRVVMEKRFNVLPLLGVTMILFAINNKKKKKVGAIEQKDIINAGLVIGGGFLLIKGTNLINSILELIGLQQSPDETAVLLSGSDPNSFWNPTFWRKFTTYTYAMTLAEAESIISQIDDSLGNWTNDQSAAIAAIKQVRTQANLSWIAYVLQQEQGKDLITWLHTSSWIENGLTYAQINDITNYVSKLPSH